MEKEKENQKKNEHNENNEKEREIKVKVSYCGKRRSQEEYCEKMKFRRYSRVSEYLKNVVGGEIEKRKEPTRTSRKK